MQVSKISSTNPLSFKSKLSEPQIVEVVSRILKDQQKIPLVKNNTEYFMDMQKGACVTSQRKKEIDEWILKNKEKYLDFDIFAEKQQVIESIKNKSLQNLSKFQTLIRKAESFFIGEDVESHPLMKNFLAKAENARFFKNFRDLFSSYLNLVPNESIDVSDNFKG